MKKFRPFLPAIIWAAIILFLTLAPGKFFPKVDYWNIFALDKYVHFTIFFIQVWLLLLGGQRQFSYLRAKSYVLFLLAGIAFGIFIEFIQTQIPARSFELNDMVANSIGCILGGLLFYIKNRLAGTF